MKNDDLDNRNLSSAPIDIDGYINIRIISTTEETVKMKAKKKYKVEKILKAFCQMKNVSVNDYRLVYKNEFLEDGMTLNAYNIDEGDVLNIYTQQTGGFFK